jgi:hypothetical protein
MKRTRLLVAACGLAALTRGVAAQGLGPTPYLCASDSPFNGTSFTWFYRETFESGSMQVPGVLASAGDVLGPSSLTDSVDCDDGTIDGSGLLGHSFFYGAGSIGITFTFDAAALGGLPTHAGIVWTDGTNFIHFEAFDDQGHSLGTLIGDHADGNNSGTTAEDRFYGWINPGGISAIHIWNDAGGIEVDHLQYGRAGACYANCDASTTPPILNVADFVCFQQHFAAGDPSANCDGSTTPPILNVADFVCFQQRFAAGCG